MSASVPVVWLNLHPDICNPERHWDTAQLQELFEGRLWRPVEGFAFHRAESVREAGKGAVVMIAGRFHFEPEDVAAINEQLSLLPWALVVIHSDEESLFPWRKLEHPAMRLWIMTPRPDRHEPGAARYIGEGWAFETRSALQGAVDDEHARPFDWCFAGQVTHDRRRVMASRLRKLPRGQLVETDSFAAGLPQPEYLEMLACSKLALAPSGPATPDSFRLYEALEAGCLPLVDALAPALKVPGYWELLFGESPPFPVITSWPRVDRDIQKALDGWPANATRASAWWQAQKRKLDYDLHDDVRLLRPDDPPTLSGFGLADLLTVVVTTSPIPSHPSTAIIEETLASLEQYRTLDGCERIVVADGVRREQAERRDDYEQYLRRLCWLTNHEVPNALPVISDGHVHQANLMREALKLVRTPLVLFVEHDTPLLGDIDFESIASGILSGQANLVRLHHEASVLEPHRHLMLDRAPIEVAGAPMLRTAQWSQRPHVASTPFYRWLIGEFFGEGSRTMIEDVMHGVLAESWHRDGLKGWQRYRVWLYAPEGDDIKRSTHLDGRGEDEKFPMVYAYDGEKPRDAPRPSAER